MKLSVAGSSRLSPPSLSILQLITLIRSLAGPPPARLSLTDGLFNWQWGRGAQPWSGETSLTKDTASQVCVDFCLPWYGKPVSQCHSQISTLLYYSQVFAKGTKYSEAEFSLPVSSRSPTVKKMCKTLHSPSHWEEHFCNSPPVGLHVLHLIYAIIKYKFYI